MSDSERGAQQGSSATGPEAPAGRFGPSRWLTRKRAWQLVAGLLLAVAVVAVIWVIHAREYASTDDARVQRTVTAISPKIPGRMIALTVDTGDTVEEGQVIARLDDRDLVAAHNAALAEVRAAEARVARAAAAARFQRTATSAGTDAAVSGTVAGRAKVAQAESAAALEDASLRERLAGARSVVAESDAALGGVEAQLLITTAEADTEVEQASQALTAARAGLTQAEIAARLADRQTTDQTEAAQQALRASQERLRQLQNGARPQEIVEAEAAVESARASQENALADLRRLERLYSRGAISAQQLDSARTRSKTADASLKQSQQRLSLVREGPREEEIKVAQAEVGRAQAALSLAQSGEDEVALKKEAVKAARAEAQQAENALALARARQGRVTVAEHQTAASRAGKARTEAALRQTAADRLAVEAKRSDVVAARASLRQQEAALQTALAGKEEVKLREAELAAAEAELKQARARLKETEVNLAEATIRSPLAGTVVQKLSEVGEVLQPGQPIVHVASRDEVWVTANFKETQVGRIRVGQPARFTVDALRGETFTGRVIEVRGGTQAAFALFPTGSPEGSYTKLVQRVPVKISVTHPDPRLTLGLSVEATVDVRKR